MPKKNEEDPKGKPKRNSSAYPKKKSSGGPPKRKSGSSPQGRSNERPAGRSGENSKKRPDHSKGDGSERPERKSSEYPKKRPDHSKGDSSERPERKPGDYPKKRPDYPKGDSSERPERKSGDYPKKRDYPKGDSSERPERPERKSGDYPKKRPDYPKGDSNERPERKSGDYPKKRPDYPKGDSSERPKRKSNDFSKGNAFDRPERNSSESPKRKSNGPKDKPKDRARVQSSMPHQGKPKVKPKEKDKDKDIPKFHPRNQHQERYDFKALVESCPELAPFVKMNMHNDESISFTNLEAVKMLNKALLKQYYGVDNWDIPATYQVPATPVRADYIHHIAELLGAANDKNIPTGKQINCLDIGVGTSCVYPIIGRKEYAWSFVGTDIDPIAIESANQIIASNPFLQEGVDCRLQADPKNIFQGIIQEGELFDLTICNPPFHVFEKVGVGKSKRKLSTLKVKKAVQASIKLGIENGELSCEGGEEAFIKEMIRESKQFAKSCYWFSTLVVKQSHLKSAYKTLEGMGASEIKIIPMGQGNKSSRVIVWSFLNKEEQKAWRDSRWNQQG